MPKRTRAGFKHAAHDVFVYWNIHLWLLLQRIVGLFDFKGACDDADTCADGFYPLKVILCQKNRSVRQSDFNPLNICPGEVWVISAMT
ncbi:hypothetical protein HYR99_34640 [Candidatus Poribacteria bacterium]|nr:hypothetical protein [Candidatus Poribacteria bacterium]